RGGGQFAYAALPGVALRAAPGRLLCPPLVPRAPLRAAGLLPGNAADRPRVARRELLRALLAVGSTPTGSAPISSAGSSRIASSRWASMVRTSTPHSVRPQGGSTARAASGSKRQRRSSPLIP